MIARYGPRGYDGSALGLAFWVTALSRKVLFYFGYAFPPPLHSLILMKGCGRKRARGKRWTLLMIPDEPAFDLGSGDVEEVQTGALFFRIFVMILWKFCM